MTAGEGIGSVVAAGRWITAGQRRDGLAVGQRSVVLAVRVAFGPPANLVEKTPETAARPASGQRRRQVGRDEGVGVAVPVGGGEAFDDVVSTVGCFTQPDARDVGECR